jgi:hypothetical protein
MMYKPVDPHVFTLSLVHERMVDEMTLVPVDVTVTSIKTSSGVMTYSQVDSLINKMRKCLMDKAIPDRLAKMLEVSNDKD